MTEAMDQPTAPTIQHQVNIQLPQDADKAEITPQNELVEALLERQQQVLNRLSVEKLADEVYEKINGRFELERRRRGL
jgi:biopolymer transport protein ExbD